MTKEEIKKALNNIPFNELEKEFKKRGIKEIFSQEELKEDLIEKASIKILEIQNLELEEVPIKSKIESEELLKILEQTDYHKLRNKFDEFGIVGTLRGGQKKNDLIESAMRRYNEIRILLRRGKNPIISKKQLIQEVERMDLERIGNIEEREKQSEINKEAKEKREAKDIINIDMNKEQVEKNLSSLQKNLKGASPTQRLILLRKKVVLENLLIEVSKKPHPFKKLADGTLAIDRWNKENGVK